METGPITNNADVIHTDDLYSRIKWLEQELNYRCTDEHSRELQALMALAKVRRSHDIGKHLPGQRRTDTRQLSSNLQKRPG